MRLLFLAATFAAALTNSVSASEPPGAREAYVERRGLIEADARCGLFTADIRSALNAGAAQARGALLRAGWNSAQVRELEQTVASVARARACNDPRTAEAAANARNAFSYWVNAGSMEFPGWERTWLARRSPTPDGWRLSQTVDGPLATTFGIRDHAGDQSLALAIVVGRGSTAPASAQLVMRAAQARVREIPLTQRIAYGIQAGTPAPGDAMTMPSTRSIERLSGGRSLVVFNFPDSAFRDLLRLDPRESVEIRVSDGRRTQSIYIEVGDVAAARTFLTLR